MLEKETQAILEGVLFMYALRNTNKAGICFFYDQIWRYFGDNGHGVNKVYKKMYFFGVFLLKWKNTKKRVLKRIDPNCLET